MRLLMLDLTDTGVQFLILLLALGVVAWWKGRRVIGDWQQFRQWQAAGKPGGVVAMPPAPVAAPPTPTAQPSGEPPQRVYPLAQIQPPHAVDFATLPAARLASAGDAMAQPPTSLWYSLEHIRKHAPADSFTFPIGWWINPQQQARLAVGQLVDDVYCGLVTAIQGGGKDNALLNMLLSLMLLNDPNDLQVVIIDGKGGLDYNGWAEKAHVWHVARHGHELIDTMDLLTAERMRRVELLYQAGVSKWENLKGPKRPPMIVVIFSELKMLQQAMKRSDIETYLESELSVWRGLGMRMFVCTQNSSNWSKEWRGAFEFFMAGTQPSRDEDKPNTGKDPKALRELGLVPPSELPAVGTAPGVLTVVHGNHGVNVRTSYIDDAQRTYWLAYLPNVTPEQATARQHQKTRLLQTLAVFRATLETKEQARKAGVIISEPTANQPSAGAVVGLTATDSEPVIALAQPADQADGYNRQELAQVLLAIQADRAKKLDDLLEIPLFVRACEAEYRKVRSISGVVKALWGSYSGPKDRVVKAALERAQDRQRQDDTLLNGLLAA